jgi:SNF2 family DNA or RNA helicase
MNLQKGSNIAVWYGLTWSLELYQQFNKRLVRPGQTEDRVIIYHILTEGTYEYKVYDTLCRKEGVQNDVLETLKVHKETVLGLGD